MKMESDLIVKQFVDKLGKFNSEEIQNYLNGDNPWKLPINENDIVKIEYGFNQELSSMDKKVFSTGILLIHRIPGRS